MLLIETGFGKDIWPFFPTMPTTINAIAKRLNISKSTVSKALNGRADVSAETRTLVMQTVAEMDYQPSAAARQLSLGRTEKIGLFLNTSIEYTIEYLIGIIPGAVRQASSVGKTLVLHTTPEHAPEALLRACRSGEFDGVILFSSRFDDIVEQLIKDDYPFVVMGRAFADPRVSYVVSDDYDGAYQATQHLIRLGHRRIAFLTRPELGIVSQTRLHAYLDALADANIEADTNLIVETQIIPESGVEPTRRLLALSDRPTAIYAFHDMVAVDVLRVLQEQGLRVPADISVIGFDGLRITQMTTPRLTTVQQPFERIGQRVVEIVAAQIEDRKSAPVREMLPVELVVRESTGPVGSR